MTWLWPGARGRYPAHRRCRPVSPPGHRPDPDAAPLGGAREGRVGAIFVEVGADNSPPPRPYRGLGLTQVGRRPGHYGGGASGDAAVSRAALTPSAMVSKSAETDYESLA